MPTPTPEHEHNPPLSGDGSLPTDHELPPGDEPSDGRTARILIVEPDARTRRALATLLRNEGYICDPVGKRDEAIGAISGASYDIAIIDIRLREGAGADLLRAMLQRSPLTKVIMLGREPMLDDAVKAMRLGAVDLLPKPINAAETIASVANAAELATRDRQRDGKLRRLQRLCTVLRTARQSEAVEVASLCGDLSGMCEELNEHVTQMKLSGEFRSLIEGELDIEALLRTSLEYMLRKTGPTNAAIFLPSNHSDYSLGAYVNYDIPKDAADVMLDHLADILAPRFDELDGVLVMDTDEDVHEHMGEDANWLSDSRVIVFACRHDDECLAVVAFFRDLDKPFPDDLVPQLAGVKTAFAEQLARVIRVHHRRIENPDEGWLGADDDADDYGMAA